MSSINSHFFEALHKEQWKEVRLGDLCLKIDYGYTTSATLQDTGIKFLRITDIVPPQINWDSVPYCNIDSKNLEKYLLEIGDIVIARTGATAGYNKYIKEKIKCIFASYLIRFRVNLNIANPHFVNYCLQNRDWTEFVNGALGGSAQPNINAKQMSDFRFKLPPLNVQQQIAEILSSFDDKIDLLHRQNKTLESLALTLFRHYTTNKELDSVIGNIVSLQAGFAFKSKDFQNFGNNKIIKIKNIQNSIIDILNTDFVGENIVNSLDSKFKILSGDILFGMTGAEIGKMGIVPQNSNSLWLNQRVGVLREKVGNTKFLAYLQLTSEIGFDYIINAASGSAQPNISAKDIENCPFYSLSTKELFSLSLQIKPLFDKIIQNLGTILSLQQMRDMLLSKILNEKVEVRDE